MAKTKNGLKGLLFTIIMLVAMLCAFSITASAEEHVHDMADATCTEPAKCKNCTYTEGYALTHSWVDSEISGKKECTVCGELLFPDFEFVTRTYKTLAETGFDAKKILNLFPREIETKYENGKYMIKDIGAYGADYFNTLDYSRFPMTLENGYWTIELSEDEYNAVIDANEKFSVNFYGEDRFWQLNYYNGCIVSDIQIASSGNVNVVLIKTSSDFVEFLYPLLGRHYRDSYSRGVLIAQETTYYLEGNDFLNAHYFGDGTLNYVSLYAFSAGRYYYYVQDFGWATLPAADPVYSCDAPLGYEDADDEFFTSLAPTVIDCTHEEYNEADCFNPEMCAICGLIKEGSEPLGHDMADATCTEPSTCKKGCGHTEGIYLGHDILIDEATDPTCIETGLTEGSHCSRCDEETIEQETVPALGHDYDDGAVTTAPTCTENGVKTFTCQNDENHTYTEKIESLGHEYDNACDSVCNTCLEERTPAEHYSKNADGKCDECGEKFKLSGGDIAGIVIGSLLAVAIALVVLGIGVFLLIKLVIKKKK